MRPHRINLAKADAEIFSGIVAKFKMHKTRKYAQSKRNWDNVQALPYGKKPGHTIGNHANNTLMPLITIC